jgi:hypothetical protein
MLRRKKTGEVSKVAVIRASILSQIAMGRDW